MPRRLSRVWGLAVLALMLSGIAPAGRAAEIKPAPPQGAGGGGTGKVVIPVFKLSGSLQESPVQEQLIPLFDLPTASLRELIARIDKAGSDPNVRGVVLLVDDAAYGSAQVEELRQALGRLREKKKDVFVHSDSLTYGHYLLVAGASRVSMSPTSDLWLTGMYSEHPYLRGLLDMLGVTPDFLTCGEYKSAAEIFMRKGPSKEADRMINWLMDSLYQTHVDLIARGRRIGPDQARVLVDAGPYTAEKARALKLIDAVEHRQDFVAHLKKTYGDAVALDKKYGAPPTQALDFSSPFAIFQLWGQMLGGGPKKAHGKAAVGVVYVEGPILLGSQQPSLFGGMESAYSSALRKALDQAAADDTIKAVVLRVDSPGGSATASEIILDATRRVKAKKPLVVSMGNMAGSGGYYVTCAADTVFADSSTITGSIGVVGGKFSTNAMWDKIGITFTPYQRGQNADLLSSAAPFTPQQRQRVQAWMDEIYGTFKKHVTDARGDRLKKPIDEIAGGRVYTGRQALELGLVDRIGTLGDAIAFAAGRANLQPTEYEVRPVPEPKNIFQQLMESGSGDGDPSKIDAEALDAAAARGMPAFLRPGAGGGSVLEMALPHLRHLDPGRVAVIRRALLRLDLMQREGAVLMMPEIAVGR